MKKTFTLFSLLASFSLAIAQPGLNSLNVPDIGTSVSYKSKADDNLSTGTTGANQTWDYSAVTFTDPSSTSQIVDPSSTGYGSSFPNANRAEKTAAGNYSFMNMTTTSQTLYGARTQGITIVYSDPLKVINLPLAYNASSTDDFAGSYTANGYPITVTGTATVTYDGYGTLKTVNGTYNNVARLKLVKTESAVTDYGDDFTMTMVTNSTSYAWYLPGSSYSLFSIIDTEILMEEMSMGSSRTAMLLDQTSTAITNTSLNSFDITIGPNPASEILNVDLKDQPSGEYQLELVNESGAISYIEKFSHSNGEVHMSNIASMPKGIYIATIKSKYGIGSEKIVKLK